MKNLYYISNKKILQVAVNLDGTLRMFDENGNYPHTGMVVHHLGGIVRVLAKCVESDLEIEDFRKEQKEKKKKEQMEKQSEKKD